MKDFQLIMVKAIGMEYDICKNKDKGIFFSSEG